jgi:hypothetical protein
MVLKDELASLMGANIPLIHLVTYEEERVIRALVELEEAQKLGITSWDIADGFQTHRAGRESFPAKDCTTETLLSHVVEKMPHGHVLVLRDFHHCWLAKRGYITRKLRNMTAKLRTQSQYLIMVTPPLAPEHDLPRELKDDVAVLAVPLPDQKDLERLFDEVAGKLADRSALPRPEVKDKLIQSALGLTTTQARLAYSRVWAARHKFDEQGIDLVTLAKKQVIRESGALEFWPAHEGEADVGGLDKLKEYLRGREQCFAPEHQDKLDKLPRGVLLAGIPGTGKSLSAKMIAGLWKWPLLRLDLAAAMGSFLGESEKNLRLAMNLADTVSPCVLWIDEVEKAFAGAGVGSINAGAPTRMLGIFLTWAEEHRTPVYLVGTANQIEGLPPEFIGRFDQLFFVDLPTTSERLEILRIHLRRAKITFPDRKFRMEELVQQSRGFVGRELERAVREAAIAALIDGDREITHEDLVKRIGQIKPLSESHQEVIKQLQKLKTEGRAFPASSDEQPAAVTGRRTLEV